MVYLTVVAVVSLRSYIMGFVVVSTVVGISKSMGMHLTVVLPIKLSAQIHVATRCAFTIHNADSAHTTVQGSTHCPSVLLHCSVSSQSTSCVQLAPAGDGGEDGVADAVVAGVEVVMAARVFVVVICF